MIYTTKLNETTTFYALRKSPFSDNWEEISIDDCPCEIADFLRDSTGSVGEAWGAMVDNGEIHLFNRQS